MKVMDEEKEGIDGEVKSDGRVCGGIERSLDVRVPGSSPQLRSWR